MWLAVVRPELSKAELKAKAASVSSVLVFTGHFDPLSLRSPLDDGQRWTRSLPPDQAKARLLTRVHLEAAEQFWGARDGVCICTDQACEEPLTIANSVPLKPEDTKLAKRIMNGDARLTGIVLGAARTGLAARPDCSADH